ncbi:MAG: M23 family metallopeptidase [Kiloniellaceae bacterium]
MRRGFPAGFVFSGALLAGGLGYGLAQEPLRFELPVACQIGSLCVVQNYVDHEPGPGAKDHTCGPLTYDKHRGIDIRVPGFPEAREGMAVIAAAPGTVKRTRDGMDDRSVREAGPEAVRGRESGNAVIIDHGHGWVSQYSHLRKGSVAVKPGDRVEAGAKLGLVGLSGKTEFPHLHFAVRKDGQTLDPFTGLPPESGCGNAGESLWSPAAQAALRYRAGGLLYAGFSGAAPTSEAILRGEHRGEALSAEANALVFWALSWGLREGDKETIRILGPDGQVFAEGTSYLPEDKAQWLRFTGRRRKAAPFAPGTYRGEYTVERTQAGRTTRVVAVTRAFEVR